MWVYIYTHTNKVSLLLKAKIKYQRAQYYISTSPILICVVLLLQSTLLLNQAGSKQHMKEEQV